MGQTLGVIIGNRGFFPDRLAREGREEVLHQLQASGYGVVALPVDEGGHGGVQTLEDARACARLFRDHRDLIDGVVVSLPNFGDEKAIANTLRWSELNVPVLVHAFPDERAAMDLGNRRDAFCGKLSVCNNLVQYDIPFTLTARHVLAPGDPSFKSEIDRFAAVCRVVRGLRQARIGAIGARPGDFNTVRFSERILEATGVSVETLDLADLLGRAGALSAGDVKVKAKLRAIQDYCPAQQVPEAALLKMARLAVVLEDWIAQNEVDATALQCWTALEEHFGVVPCTVMSMLSESLRPSACEVDVTGALSMYALQLASGSPSALVDWNNNYGDAEDQAVVFHCSNFPRSLLESPCMRHQDIIAASVGAENTYGTCVGRIKPGPMTFLRLSTDDLAGHVRGYVGEGAFTEAPLDSFGGVGVLEIPELQGLLRFICRQGFEHHVAVSRTLMGSVLEEALRDYLKWDLHRHVGKGSGHGCVDRC